MPSTYLNARLPSVEPDQPTITDPSLLTSKAILIIPTPPDNMPKLVIVPSTYLNARLPSVESEPPTITDPSLLTPLAELDVPPVNTPKLVISAFKILYELKKNKELSTMKLSNFNIETLCMYSMNYRCLIDKKKCKF